MHIDALIEKADQDIRFHKSNIKNQRSHSGVNS